MDNFYLKIDSSFLKTLDQQQKIKLKKLSKELGKDSQYQNYVRLCPYCNHFMLLSVSKDKIEKWGDPKICPFCAESTPLEKIKYSIKKVNIFYGLSSFCASGNGDKEDQENERALLEQCVVALATGIEIFFKDIFVIGMDLKYVKNEYSLVPKFYAEAKNEFVNIGKIIKKFNEELKIELDSILGKDILTNLNILMLKRNVIVHNNGIADKIFISQSGIDCRLGTPIPISNNEIGEYLSTVARMVEKIEQEFNRLFLPELQSRLIFHINSGIE